MQRDWELVNDELDFRVDRWERSAACQPGGSVHVYEARFQDIVPDQRIILAYEISLDEQRIPALLATVELKSTSPGTRLGSTGRCFSGRERNCSKISVRSTSNWNRQRWRRPLLRRTCASRSCGVMNRADWLLPMITEFLDEPMPEAE